MIMMQEFGWVCGSFRQGRMPETDEVQSNSGTSGLEDSPPTLLRGWWHLAGADLRRRSRGSRGEPTDQAPLGGGGGGGRQGSTWFNMVQHGSAISRILPHGV